MKIRSFGVGRRQRECERLLSERLLGRFGELILLPIPTTRDNIYISGTDRTLESLFPLLSPETLLVGYSIPNRLREVAQELGSSVFDAAEDEEFLLENAKISAKGALGYLLTNRPRLVSEERVGIVGYGRIGRELTRLLLLLGGEICLYSTRQSVVLELCETGVFARLMNGETDLSGLDLLVNTSPSPLPEGVQIPKNMQIIDLASGNNFEPSASLTKLSSIPDAFYPLTAGRLYAEAVLRFVERGENR